MSNDIVTLALRAAAEARVAEERAEIERREKLDRAAVNLMHRLVNNLLRCHAPDPKAFPEPEFVGRRNDGGESCAFTLGGQPFRAEARDAWRLYWVDTNNVKHEVVGLAHLGEVLRHHGHDLEAEDDR